MRKYLIPVAAAGLALSSSMALANMSTGGVGTEAETVGTVSSWNAQTQILKLTDGSVFHLPSAYASNIYNPGDTVQVAYQILAGGKRINQVSDETAKM